MKIMYIILQNKLIFLSELIYEMIAYKYLNDPVNF